MSPRRSVADARQTRAVILDRAMEKASIEGLDGLTIGRLAADLGMSKSGLLGHFGSKESLQLAVLDAASAVFAREVVARAGGTPAGMSRLVALCDAWVSFLERGVFPGGCLFTAAAAEFDDRPGPVRDAVAGIHARWQEHLRRHVRQAVTDGDLPADTDSEQVVFELVGIVLALNHALQLNNDRRAPERARDAIARLLCGRLLSEYSGLPPGIPGIRA
ncbi:TetR family transcriptional regulator C-terminal domain-containing protein [Phytoactinopolyspora mesophila]|uniref:TetR family transcriptional regulator n=1 Tax=Phytoactinopolyspora mesophila TaxID=2650750 RepID=A0A7K3MB40_9ACTN|nr:TetR family transcriptional regulator [Phytoactinopolyspora mesophila]